MLTLYNVISSDGFIARKDGSEDFVPDSLWQKFLDLCLEYKILIIGRKTYEAVQRYDDIYTKPFENLPIQKIVISSDKNFILKSGYVLVNSPEEAAAKAPNALVSSGPGLNNYLLEKGFVQNIIQYKLADFIGDGIKPFNQKNLNSQIHLEIYDWKA
jgi:dihydrofolate reductase